MAKQPIIFCDFDGTITRSDNIIAIMKRFASPEWAAITDSILGQQISVREGVTKLFQLLPSSLRQEVTQYAISQADIREGFERFLAYLNKETIPFYVLSGGIDFFVDPILAPYNLPQGSVFRNETDFSGERIKIIWPHRCDALCDLDCGLCKTSLFRSLSNKEAFKIMIGDSITDLAAAKQADLVFARGFLLKKCQELGLRHHAYESFDDILMVLETQPWRYQDTWDELSEVKDVFAQRGWFPGTSGNLSIKTTEEPLTFLVTASGKDKTKRTPEDFLFVNEASQPMYPTHLKPSAETMIHALIYQQMGGRAGAVFHIHSMTNNLVSDLFYHHKEVVLENNELIKAFNIWEEGASISVPIVHNHADIPLLTAEIAKVLREEVPGVLIHNHGIYAWGKNSFEAKKHLEAFEFLFEFTYKKWKNNH
jgi:2-hydroxy-3-keto-5-methylthiopentenyl-1-phosphate phosphatase